ncbi:MAG TPA: imidazolonepropionase [Oligoflexia bacterium]|nr:imidazolonepropionase [Oligoflexia bacterium]HMR24906.1 imidazolonepropionase [Oligoflexia bacterium]
MKTLIAHLNQLQHFDAQAQILQMQDCHILIDQDGRLEQISETPIHYNEDVHLIDGKSLLGLPAFIDCHSHSIFAGNRAHEFEMKCQGKSYMDIAKAGGGILSTKVATEQASDTDLLSLLEQRIKKFKAQGVYGLEIKTGYGLSHAQEVRQLRLLKQLQKTAPIKLWITYLGAHAIPKDTTKENYMYSICNETLPLIAQENLADFIDIFVDEGFFSSEDLKVLIDVCQKLKLKVKAHIDEIKNLGAADIAAKHKIVSVDHCRHTKPKQLNALYEADVQVVYLPATSFYINEGFVHMQDIRPTGVKPAISLDYNPGSQPSMSWPFLLHLGMKKMGMTEEELLYATTIAPLKALHEDLSHWSFTEGQNCKLNLFNAKSLSELAYRYGENLLNQSLISF